MSDRVWHKGPPPHVGWWNASSKKDKECWRWWDGKHWSIPVEMGAYPPAYYAECKSVTSDHFWTDYWPENARVPRLDPTGGHWTFNDGVDPEYAGEIDLAFRDGDFVSASRGRQYWDWAIRGNGGDILAWRPAA